MAEVLVLLENQDQHLRAATAELLTFAQQLGEPTALWAGDQAPSMELQEELARCGVKRVDWLRGPNGEDLTTYVARPLARAVAQRSEERRVGNGSRGRWS